jgi:hypothetical protein
MARQTQPRYARLVQAIFFAHYKEGEASFEFRRQEIEQQAKRLRLPLPKNLGDVLYSFRYRRALPKAIRETAPEGYDWTIKLSGRGRYRFQLAKTSRIRPSPDHYVIKIPDATPELVAKHAPTGEQSLLAKVRYNRLVDTFLRLTAYSLQNHLRTTVPDIGQIETDELYVGVRNSGEQFIIPVQAKGRRDEIGAVQIQQDVAMCKDRFPSLTCRPVAVQSSQDTEGREIIVMFELTMEAASVRVVDEKQYRLVPADDISPEDLAFMAQSP